MSNIKLNEFNYVEWARQMMVYLRKEGLWSVVSGGRSAPEESAYGTEKGHYLHAVEQYQNAKERAFGTIASAFETAPPPSISKFLDESDPDPKLFWEAIKTQYMAQKPGSCYNAHARLFSIFYEKDETLYNLCSYVQSAMKDL